MREWRSRGGGTRLNRRPARGGRADPPRRGEVGEGRRKTTERGRGFRPPCCGFLSVSPFLVLPELGWECDLLALPRTTALCGWRSQRVTRHPGVCSVGLFGFAVAAYHGSTTTCQQRCPKFSSSSTATCTAPVFSETIFYHDLFIFKKHVPM